MVDQAQVIASEHEAKGRELPPRAVARNTAEFLHDMTTLEMVRRVDQWARECARHTAQALELNA